MARDLKTAPTPYLYIGLLVASFLLGVFITKVQYLEGKNNTQTAASPTTTPQTPPVAEKPKGKIKPISSTDHVRGNANAKVTLVDYSDLECPFCKNFNPTLQGLLKTYDGKIKLAYRHFPLSFHQNAQKEAEASECVAELGGNDKFWQFVDTVFERTTSNGLGFALEKLGPLAAELGVDQAQFQACLDSGKYTQLVKDETADGTTGGVSGTPSTFIIDAKGNSQLVVGAQPLESMKTVIDQALSK